MSQAITFDTHAFVKRLCAVGFTEEQSEVFAEEQSRLIEGRLATKHDMELLRRDMKEMEINLRREIKEMELRLTLRMGGMLAVAVAVIVMLDRLL